jgi:heme/copper-type cytochrome/quinol oxidase subunit 4
MESLSWLLLFTILIVVTVVMSYLWTMRILKHQKREDTQAGEAISRHPIILNPVYISMVLHTIVTFALVAFAYWIFT